LKQSQNLDLGKAGFRGAVLAEVEPLSGAPLNDHWLAAQRKDYDLTGCNHRTLEYFAPGLPAR